MFLHKDSFTIGEITPRLYARQGLDQYKNAVAILDNMYPWSYGGLERRPGTEFIKGTKFDAKKSRLIPFVFGTTQTYVLEFGDFYMRVYKDGAQVFKDGSPYEIVTPWGENDLDSIHFTNSFDKMWIVTGKHPIYQITRKGHSDWTIAEYVTVGPFLDDNVTATTLTASATSGTVTITASTATFSALDVGRSVAIKGKVPVWAAGTAYATGAMVSALVSGTTRLYKCVSGGTSGSDIPYEEGDAVSDGTCLWKYIDDGTWGWGHARITAYTSPTVVTAVTSTSFPITSATKKWKLGAFYSTVRPRAITVWNSRMWIGGSSDKPQTLWISRTNGWDDFTDSAIGLDTDAITLTLDVGRTNAIYWFETMKDAVVCGTSDAIWHVSPNDTTKAITASTIKAQRVHTTGASSISGAQIGNIVMFTGVNDRVVYELAYNWSGDSYECQQMTLLAEHITGTGLKEFAYQQRPYGMVWFSRKDGKLVTFTYLREQKVTGWATHTLGGGGKVESIVSVPASDYSQDQIYMIVNRTINGTVRRYVEVLRKSNLDVVSTTDWFFVDCGLTYNGTPATTISGLSHLEGATVAVFTDGANHPECVVTGGAITLKAAASKVSIGLPYKSVVKTLRLDIPGTNLQSKQKTITKITIDCYQSFGGKVGRDLDHLDPLLEIPTWGGPLPQDGFKDVSYGGGWDRDGQFYVVQDLPLPLNIRSFIVQFSA